MEKINILIVSEDKLTAKGVKFWGVKDANGVNYTVWEKDIMEELRKNIGKEISAEIKTNGNFKNIRAIGTENNINENAGVIGTTTKEDIQPQTTPLNSTRNNSIISQCMVKAGAEMFSRTTAQERLEDKKNKMLGNYVKLCLEAYKETLKELENGN